MVIRFKLKRMNVWITLFQVKIAFAKKRKQPIQLTSF